MKNEKKSEKNVEKRFMRASVYWRIEEKKLINVMRNLEESKSKKNCI